MNLSVPTIGPSLIDQCALDGGNAGLCALLADISLACITLSNTIAKGAVLGLQGDAGVQNVQGETQKKLDVVSNNLFLRSDDIARRLAGMASEEEEEPVRLRCADEGCDYLLLFDPLDGSSNIDVNVSVGTIFSVLRAPHRDTPPTDDDFLQPGVRQVCAGYAIYGPSTMLVYTVGNGVNGYTLDPDTERFVLTHPDMKIPRHTREFAINASNERFWEPPVRRYVRECLAGTDGARGENFNMRWIASMVAEVHRILIRGGVFMYPRDNRDPAKPGRLRLMYEANPMAFIVEQAGGEAITGRERMLEVQPEALHQRIPVILGSAEEVQRIMRYHEESLEESFTSPLFNTRTLFRQQP